MLGPVLQLNIFEKPAKYFFNMALFLVFPDKRLLLCVSCTT